MGIARTFAKNAACQLGTNLTNKLVGLFLAVYLANVLAPENYGVYAWIIAMTILFDAFASAGTGNAIAKFIPDALESGKKKLVAGYFGYLFRVRLLGLGAVVIAAFIFAEPIAALLFGKAILATPLRLVAAFLVIYNLYGYLQALFVSLMRNEGVFVADFVSSVLRVILIVILVEATGSLYFAILGYAVSLIAGACVLLAYMLSRHSFVASEKEVVDAPRVNSYLQLAILGSFSLAILTNIDTLMVSAMLPIENAGFYRIALAWASVPIGLLPIYIAFPVLSSLAAKPVGHLRDGFAFFFKYLSAFTIPFAFLAAYVAAPLINFFYSPEYAPVIGVLEVISALIALNSLTVLLMLLLNAIDRQEVHIKIYSLAILLNIALNYAFISAFGVIGAAYAVVLTYCFIVAGLIVSVKKSAGFGLNAMNLAKPLVSALAMFGILRYALPAPQGLAMALVFSAAGFGIYFVVQLLIKGIALNELAHLKRRVLNS